jgi:AP-4 complex subunit epsilon-1
MIRRKALLIMMSISSKHPDVLADIKPIISEALNDGETPVVFAGISMLEVAIKADPFKFKDMTKKLGEILYRVVDHKFPKEYDYHKIPAPWVQIEILKMFELMGKNDQACTQLMVDPIERTLRKACNFQMHFNKAIIQQCVKTISNIYPHRFLLQQAEESLGRFFEAGNNNMKYFGIDAMSHLAKSNKEIVDKWQIVILECMDSPDITLAEKTLGMLVQIANEDNTTIILDRLMRLTDRSTDEK